MSRSWGEESGRVCAAVEKEGEMKEGKFVCVILSERWIDVNIGFFLINLTPEKRY